MTASVNRGFYGVIPFIDPRKLEIKSYLYDKNNQHSDFVFLALGIIQSSREEPIAGTSKRYIDLYLKCWDL
ncbi:41978_t:CDS:2 [Gigaspora margarita]|uniref:41978_t:CDS:1 n=1 Tax=Gigaspora margarita TaxID=4874 RepID=A0ABN7UA85_GIGMA|nr:41978_t:CDS:2 [Gigaspora margarita]